MAKETTCELWLGTDFQYVFHVKNNAEDTAIEITGWALSWMVKRYRSDADASAILTKTTASGIAIAGTFHQTPALNTQRATVTLADTDSSSLNPGLYHYELKRTDDGYETVLAYGQMVFNQGVHR